MPEPSSKLYFTDPRATPDTDSVSVSSLGSRLEQAMSEDVQEVRTSRLSPPPRRGRTCGCGGEAQSDRESTASESQTEEVWPIIVHLHSY